MVHHATFGKLLLLQALCTLDQLRSAVSPINHMLLCPPFESFPRAVFYRVLLSELRGALQTWSVGFGRLRKKTFTCDLESSLLPT